jgi:DNA-binding NarL/FixJ family response regulator
MNEPFIRIGIAEDQLLFRESIVGILNQSADMQVVLVWTPRGRYDRFTRRCG